MSTKTLWLAATLIWGIATLRAFTDPATTTGATTLALATTNILAYIYTRTPTRKEEPHHG